MSADLAVRLAEYLQRAPVLGALAGPVVVGCSGGADSSAVLALAAAAQLRPIAVYVDHGLRAESARDGDVVEQLAEQLGVSYVGVPVHVAPGPNLEARARDARFEALSLIADDAGIDAIVLGHTADDRAETFLLNLLRGAGRAGLAAPRERRGRFVRPMLALRRSDTLAVCERIGHVPVADPMNDDDTFLRVWVRNELLPMLSERVHRDVVDGLNRQADVFAAEDDYLDELAVAAWPGIGGSDASALTDLPLALQRRAVRNWLGGLAPSLAETERVLDVARGVAKATELSGGRRVSRHRGRLDLECPAAPGESPAAADIP